MPDAITLPDWLDRDGLRLRPVAPRDVPAVVEACQDEDIQRFTRIPSPFREEHARSFLDRSREQLDAGEAAHLVVADGDDDTVLGAVGLEIDGAQLAGEIGYWTAPWARRRGVATEAVRRMVQLAVGELGLGHVGLQSSAVNLASNLVALRAGLRPEGVAPGAGLDGPSGDASAPRVDMFRYGATRDRHAAGPRVTAPADLARDDVRVRAIEPSDVPALVAACQDPEIVHWTQVPEGYGEEDAVRFLVESLRGQVVGDRANLVAVDADDRLLASVGFPRLDLTNRVGEVGYWAAPEARGRGVTTTAVELVTAWSFDALELERVEIIASVNNPASNRVAEKAGFEHESVRRRALRVAPATQHDANVWVRTP